MWTETLREVHEKDLRWDIAEGQPFCTLALAGVLEAIDDPDAPFMATVGDGVEMGVDAPLPRSPLVWREKTSWRLPEWPGDLQPAKCNYSSGETHAHIVDEKIAEGRQAGRIVGPVGQLEARGSRGGRGY